MKYSLLILVFIVAARPGATQVLYKCESPGKDTVTWLLGTCHALPKDAFNYDRRIDSIINKAEVVFSELFVKPNDDEHNHQLSILKQKIYYPLGKTLANYITADELDLVADFYKKRFNISKRDFRNSSRFLPLIMHRNLTSRGDKYERMDNRISQYAYVTQKKVVLLDNVALLSNTFAMLGRLYDGKWLVDQVNHFDQYASKDSLLKAAYLNQDTATMKRITREQPSEDNRVMVSERNAHWEKLLEQHGTSRNFLFAGIAHLLFDGDGLLDYYRKKGYTISVEPVVIRQ